MRKSLPSNRSVLLLSAVLLCLFFRTSLSAAEVRADSLFGFRVMVKEAELKPAVRTVVLLHGYGSNEEDLMSLAESFPKTYRILSLRAPFSISNGSYRWFDVHFDKKRWYSSAQFEQSLAKLQDFLEKLRQRYHSENMQLTLCGFSQGAMMSYAVAVRSPKLVNAIVVMSGRLVPEIVRHAAQKRFVSHVQVLVTHGTKDNVIPIADARSAHTTLDSLGMHPIYKEYKARHEITSTMAADVVEWLHVLDDGVRQ